MSERTIKMLDRLKARDDTQREAIGKFLDEVLQTGDLRTANSGHTQAIVFTREELKNFIFFAINYLED